MSSTTIPPSPTPPPPPLTGPPTEEPPPELAPADLRLVFVAVAIGVLFDLAVRREPASVAAALAVGGTSLGLLASGRLHSAQSRVLVMAAPVFACFVIIRNSPWLVPLDLAAAAGLLVLGVAVSTGGSLQALSIRDLGRQPHRLVATAGGTVPFLGRWLLTARRRTQWRRGASVVTGLALAAPVVAVLLALLASGDALTGALLSGVSATGAVDHLVVVCLGVGGATVLLYRAASDDDDDPSEDARRFLGITEALVVLGCLVVLFAAFALLQLVGALGVADQILDDPAETANWARQGFFQLLWAAALTLVVLVALDAVTVRPSPAHHRAFGRLAALTGALTLVVVASSVLRIVRYSDAFGLTMLRLYSALFGLWVGVVFLLFCTRMLVPALGRRWVTAAGGVGLMLLFSLNVANPEAVVVRWDVQHTDPVDADYLSRDLSTDAIPALVKALDRLDATSAAEITRALCLRDRPGEAGVLSWNRSRAEARRALAGLCD